MDTFEDVPEPFKDQVKLYFIVMQVGWEHAIKDKKDDALKKAGIKLSTPPEKRDPRHRYPKTQARYTHYKQTQPTTSSYKPRASNARSKTPPQNREKASNYLYSKKKCNNLEGEWN